MKQQVLNGLKIIIIGLALSAGISYATNWVAPVGNPPGNNAEAPVNIGNSSQSKLGAFGSNGLASFGGFLVLGNSTFGDYNVDPPLNGSVKIGSLVHNNSSDTHVCAAQNGTLFLCGQTPPPPPGGNLSKQQIYSINSSGTQVSSGDCSAPLGACTNNTFITPVKYVAGSLNIQIIGAGGGGGGGFAYPYYQGGGFLPGGECAGNFASTATDTGPASAKCQVNTGGGGGGGGAKSSFQPGTQLSLQYDVSVGVGGNGGTRKGFGFGLNYPSQNLVNWINSISIIGNAQNGQDGGVSEVRGPLPQTTIVASANGGSGGKGGFELFNPHTVSSSNGIGGLGGSSGAGSNLVPGQPGNTGRLSIWKYILDSTFQADLVAYGPILHPIPPSSSATGDGGAGGAGDTGGSGGNGLVPCTNGGIGSGGGGGGALTPFSPTLGNGCRGGHGQVIFTWEETP